VKPTERLIDVAAAVSDGGVVDWVLTEAEASPSERQLVGHLRVLERLASVHAGLPPVAAFERSLHDSLRQAAATASTPPATAPTTWGPLTIVERIGSGTYADVYRARDSHLDRPVALKLLRHRDESGTAMDSEAIEEARLLARIRHPNVVTVYGAERIAGRVGFWMEFVDGQTLEQELQDRGPFSADQLVEVGTALCRALGAVHGAGLLHRDVKAQNVMRDREGRVLLADFGTGRELTASRAAGELAGTPLYLAPEALNGAPASMMSDVYGLGVLLYHLATGSFPVSGRSLRDLRDAHARGAHVPLETRRPDLPARLTSVIERTVATTVADRYQSAVAVEAALLGAAKGRRWWPHRRLAAVALVMVFGCVSAEYVLLHRSSGADVSQGSLRTSQLTFNPVEFATTAAAISPNGEFLAYADSSGLTVKTLSTNQLRRIPVPEAWIDGLTWFPDSVGLLAHGRGTWRTTITGDTPRQLVDSGWLSVSPDGRHLALSNASQAGIRLLTVDGQDLGPIVVAGRAIRIGRPVWSPDGRRIAYWISRQQPDRSWRPAIESCRLDGSGRTVIVSQGPFGSAGMAWSSDGRMFFSRPQAANSDVQGALWQVRVNTVTGQPLADPAAIWQPSDFFFQQLSVTADARALVYQLNRRHTNVYLADVDPKTLALTGLRQAVLAESENSPASWVPGGDALLFESNSKWNGIYRQGLDGQQPQEFLVRPKAHVFQAVVSPDATSTFYLVAAPGQSTTPLMRVATAGGVPEALFAVSPDASWLKCSRAAENVCVVGELTRGQLRLTPFDPSRVEPRSQVALPAPPSKESWDLSPDGRQVVSLDATGPSVHLVVADLASGTVRTLKSDSLDGAAFVAWCRNGKGWIVTRFVGYRGSEVLYVDNNGQSRTLWKSTFQMLYLPMLSPDGRRLAFGSEVVESSVWMLQGF
jgi:serine/threonine protein kinase/Tol biopolymer transport system component